MWHDFLVCDSLHTYINTQLIYRVIRNDFPGSNNLPPRSPDATLCDFFLWGYVKDHVYVPPLPASIPEMKIRIRTATETTTPDILHTVWIRKTNYMSLFVFFISLLIVAQHVSGNRVPIIRS